MAYISRNVSDTDRRLNIGSFVMSLGKFAIDSAIDVSLKGFSGGKKLYQTILQEKLKVEPNRLKCEDVKLMENDGIQSTKMEGFNEFKHQCKTGADRAAVGVSEPMKKKIPEGWLKEMEVQDPKKKPIFIRSRL